MKGSLRRQLDLIAIELPVGSHQYITERLRLGDEHSVKRITMVGRERPQAAGIFCSEWQRFDARGQGRLLWVKGKGELPQGGLNHQLGDAYRAEEKSVGRLLDFFALSLSQLLRSGDRPEEDVRIQNQIQETPS